MIKKTIIFNSHWRLLAFVCSIGHDGFYFRIHGYGMRVINRNITPPPFSIRYGHRNEIRIGKWGIKFLGR